MTQPLYGTVTVVIQQLIAPACLGWRRRSRRGSTGTWSCFLGCSRASPLRRADPPLGLSRGFLVCTGLGFRFHSSSGLIFVHGLTLVHCLGTHPGGWLPGTFPIVRHHALVCGIARCSWRWRCASSIVWHRLLAYGIKGHITHRAIGTRYHTALYGICLGALRRGTTRRGSGTWIGRPARRTLGWGRALIWGITLIIRHGVSSDATFTTFGRQCTIGTHRIRWVACIRQGAVVWICAGRWLDRVQVAWRSPRTSRKCAARIGRIGIVLLRNNWPNSPAQSE